MSGSPEFTVVVSASAETLQLHAVHDFGSIRTVASIDSPASANLLTLLLSSDGSILCVVAKSGVISLIGCTFKASKSIAAPPTTQVRFCESHKL